MLVKQIQLSERLEFLMLFGNIVQEHDRLVFNPSALVKEPITNKVWTSKEGERMVVFTRELVDALGVYPLLQRYVENKQDFKEKYL